MKDLLFHATWVSFICAFVLLFCWLSFSSFMCLCVSVRTIPFACLIYILCNSLLTRALKQNHIRNMGRGVSAGGGQSSLGYLFGSGEAPKAATEKPVEKPAPPSADKLKEIPAGIQGSAGNNYFRADGQNTGNFITVRTVLLVSTKLSSVCALLVCSSCQRCRLNDIVD